MHTALRLVIVAASVALAGGPRWVVADATGGEPGGAATIAAAQPQPGDAAALRDGVDAPGPILGPAVDALPSERASSAGAPSARAARAQRASRPSSRLALAPHDARGPPRG